MTASGGTDVLFVTYGGGHVAMVVPVARALMARGLRCRVLALTTAYAVAEAAGVPVMGFRDLVGPEDAEAIAIGERLAGEVGHGSVPREETVAYMGLSYVDLRERLGETEAERLFARSGRQAFLPITVMERLIRALRPGVVVATSAPRAEQAAILAAGRLGVRSLCMVDLFAATEVAWVGQPGYADRVCVLATWVADRLVAAGRRRDEIAVTGNPAFSRLADPALPARGEALAAARGWQGHRVILFASQPEPAAHHETGAPGDPTLPRRIEAALMRAVARHPGWWLVIRPHPSETLVHGELPPRVTVSGPSDDLAATLAAASAVVTMTSTVGLEAALMGVPLVTVGLSLYSSITPYAEMGIAHEVTDLDDLEAALGEALAGRRPAGVGLPASAGAAAAVADEVMALLGAQTL